MGSIKRGILGLAVAGAVIIGNIGIANGVDNDPNLIDNTDKGYRNYPNVVGVYPNTPVETAIARCQMTAEGVAIIGGPYRFYNRHGEGYDRFTLACANQNDR